MSFRSQWRAGSATCDITPSEPMWLAGWASRTVPACGVASRLFVKAAAVQFENESPFLFVTLDLIAIPREISEHVCGELERLYGVPRPRILLNASHTHTGPEIRPDKVPFFGIPKEFALKIPKYVEELKEKLIRVASEAIKSVSAVRMACGASEAHFAVNRRNAEGPADFSVPVLAILDAHRHPQIIIFGYACHCLTLPSSFVEYCAEYAGYACESLELRYPGATAMFVSGASADVNPAESGTLEIARRNGGELATSVENALNSAREFSGPVRSEFREVPLDFIPLPSREELESNLQSDDLPLCFKSRFLLEAINTGTRFPDHYLCPVQVVRFGEQLLLIALGGEPVAQFALDFQREYGPKLVWVAGYSNDMFGYLPTREVQSQGGYEAGRAVLWSALPAAFTGETEERVKAAVQQLVEQTR